MKRSIALILMFSVAALTILSGCAPKQQAESQNDSQAPTESTYSKPKFLSIGTAASGGAYYPIGISMAEIVTNDLGIQATAQITGGAVENNALIQDGTLDVAITQSPMAYAAVNGTSPYDKKLPKVQAMFTGLSMGIFHVVTLEKTGIKTMEDLKGKRIAMGPAGGGAINMAKDVWGEFGFSVDDVNATYISYSDGISALKDGNVDAVIVQSAAPASAIQELTATNKDVVIINIADDLRKKIVEKYPYYSELTLAKDVYGLAEDVNVVYLSNMIVCSADLNEELVYDLTKAFFENIEKIQQSNPAAKALSLEKAALNLPIPLHPGAERYFKEVGVLK